jgi:hypothetical protein
MALRILMLVLAAGSVGAAVVLGRARGHVSDSGVRYVCAMHAQITSSAPSTCSLCGMKLEPVQTSGAPPLRESTYQTYDIMRRRAYGPNVPAPAWVLDDGTVTAILYTDEVAHRQADEKAVFAPSADPSSETELRALEGAPEPWDGSTLRVRFGASRPLPPHEVGWLKRATRSPEPPVIPYTAVLEGAEGPYVLTLGADGRTLEKRPVAIGRVFGGAVAVLSGLRSADRVLNGSAFFLDAERRLQRADTIALAR